MKSRLIKANDWFSAGRRLPYDPRLKIIEGETNNDTLQAFHKVTALEDPWKDQTWLSFLPGFPDGSFGWSRVDQLLPQRDTFPRLFVEYIGQGDSDKPKSYPYGIMERADLVEAFWEYYGISETMLITFDFSSLVAMELLRRQEEKSSRKVNIQKVLMINGGYFVDAHSHPWITTPMLKTKFGKMGTRMLQKSPAFFRLMIKDLWSKEYQVKREELNEVYEAIGRRNGALFLHNGAGFVDQHKQHAERLDLREICKEMHEQIDFHIVGSEKDQFEPQQVVKAMERVSQYEVEIRMVPGGHMTTSEQPELLVSIIQEISSGLYVSATKS